MTPIGRAAGPDGFPRGMIHASASWFEERRERCRLTDHQRFSMPVPDPPPSAPTRAPLWPAVAIAILLVLMVAVPPWGSSRREAIRDRINRELAPARTALLATELGLTSAVVESHSFLITGDTAYLSRMRGSLREARSSFELLSAAAEVLGPEFQARVGDVETAAADWLDPEAELVDPTIRADPDTVAARVDEGEDVLAGIQQAAARADAELDRIQGVLQAEIDAWERRENGIVAALGVAAVAVTLIAAWLMRRLAQTTHRLFESETRFRQIAENLREAIWITDPDNTEYYYINPAQEAIWGRPQETALRDARSFLASVHPDDRAGVEAALRSYAEGEQEVEYRIVRPDGNVRWVRERSYPIRDAGGHVFRLAGIAEDVTERKRVEEERERLLESERSAREEAERALHVRDTVLRIVSHDLKNPLHTLGMAADLLEMPLSGEH